MFITPRVGGPTSSFLFFAGLCSRDPPPRSALPRSAARRTATDATSRCSPSAATPSSHGPACTSASTSARTCRTLLSARGPLSTADTPTVPPQVRCTAHMHMAYCNEHAYPRQALIYHMPTSSLRQTAMRRRHSRQLTLLSSVTPLFRCCMLIPSAPLLRFTLPPNCRPYPCQPQVGCGAQREVVAWAAHLLLPG